MPQFDVYTSALVKQGIRYRVTAPTAEEALRRVLVDSLEPQDHMSVREEECLSEAVDWVWDDEGNDVTPVQDAQQQTGGINPRLPNGPG
jgi:hypothetical protein